MMLSSNLFCLSRSSPFFPALGIWGWELVGSCLHRVGDGRECASGVTWSWVQIPAQPLLPSLSGARGCPNKAPQMGGFKPTDTHSLMVLKPGSPKRKVSAGLCPSSWPLSSFRCGQSPLVLLGSKPNPSNLSPLSHGVLLVCPCL